MDPIPLGTCDIRPIIPEELRRTAFDIILRHLEGSSLAHKVDLEQWRTRLNAHLHELIVGDSVDLAHLQQQLRRAISIDEGALFVLMSRIAEDLRALDIAVKAAPTKLDEAAQQALLARAPTRTPAKRVYQHDKRMPLGEVLVQHGVITREQLGRALAVQRLEGGRLGTVLIDMRIISEETLASFLSVQVGYPAVESGDLVHVPEDALAAFPKPLAIKYSALPLSLRGQTLRIAMIDPSDLNALDAIAFATGLRIVPAVAPEAVIRRAHEQYYGVAGYSPASVPQPQQQQQEELPPPLDSGDMELVLEDDHYTIQPLSSGDLVLELCGDDYQAA